MEIIHDTEGYEGRFSDLVILIRDVVRRRWLTLVLVAAAVFVAGAIGIMLLPPRYGTTAQIRIDPSRNPLAGNDNAGGADTLTPEAIETEISLINSVDVARDVVRRLHLARDPLIAKAIDKPGKPRLTGDEREAAIANHLLNDLSVSRQKLSYILAVTYTSGDAAESARITNGFADAYVDAKAGTKAGTAQTQADWFRQRLDLLNREVNSAASQAATYRAQAGITSDSAGNNTGTVVDQQIAPLSSQLATAESEAAAAHAKLNAARQQIARGGLDSISEVLGSPVISDLRRQRAEVQRNVQEVQARYGEKHPESIRVHDQLDAIDQQIKAEADRVVASLQASAQAADASTASLRSAMGRLQSQQASNTVNAARADMLDREAKTKQAAYDRMSQLSLASTEAAKNMISSAEVVQRADPPSAPTSPKRPLLLAALLIVALGIGAGVVAIQEMMTKGLRTVDEVQSKLGMPVLAAIPKLPRNASPADMLLDKPTSLFSESLRIARAAILGVRSAKPQRVIAITSALPSEGKTTTALSFARTLAINDQKTLLLECDVRRAQMRTLVGTPPTGPGIVEVLHGEASLAEAITPGDVPKLDHLLVSAPYFSSEDLFGGGTMEALLASLRKDYETIVLDLPPLVGLADGRFLAVLADQTVLCVKWNATPADAASAALGWLASDGANPVGVIYTMVDSSADAISGLYYSQKYTNYYQAA